LSGIKARRESPSQDASQIRQEAIMQVVKVGEELWMTNLMPEGILERWRVDDGGRVKFGEPLAEVRIEDALHEITAPGCGVLWQEAKAGDIVQPGEWLGSVG
jgi:hypothetical protein